MLNITMTKRGIGTVNFTQSSEGGMVVVTLIGNISFETTPDGANELYTQYRHNGFTVKPQKEKKVYAPKEPKAEKPKSKRFIYCKESRQIWAKEYSRRIAEGRVKISSLKGNAYWEARHELETTVKAEMKVWEASKADEVNEMLQKHFAERDAQ